MRHTTLQLGLFVLVLGSAAPGPASAGGLIIQADKLASRAVLVRRADVNSNERLASIHRALRIAAREVCHEQYPREVHPYLRACTTGSLRDAMEQLRQLHSSDRSQPSTGRAQLVILVRSK